MDRTFHDTAAMLEAVQPDALAGLLRDCGYRVERLTTGDGSPELRSAAQGLGFKVRFAPGTAEGHVDFAFLCPVAFEGGVPPDLANRWNSSKRFARLSASETQVVLTMDVLLLGGVGPTHLRAQCELWDRLLQELVLMLQRPAGPRDGPAAT